MRNYFAGGAGGMPGGGMPGGMNPEDFANMSAPGAGPTVEEVD